MTGFKTNSAHAVMQTLPERSTTENLAARLRSAAANGDDTKLNEAAEQFESYFVQTLLKDMRKTTAIAGEVSGGKEMETWNMMFDQEIADRISKGSGLGLADMIVRSIKAQAGDDGHIQALAARSYAGNLPSAARLAPGRRDGWSWPLPEGQPGQVSSNFGLRSDPFHGNSRHHGGLDVRAPKGTPVLAMADGVVVSAGKRGAYGNFVELRHEGGVVTRYAHQDRLDVQEGQRVRAGAQLGTVGSTGRATGDHLHLEVRIDGHGVDPYHYLNGEHR
jgi:murein DD-endopeptidase MepM/ murein hydrolase activator NlpD